MAMEAEAAPLRTALEASTRAAPAWASALPARLAVTPDRADRPSVLLAVNGTDPVTGVDCIGSTAAGITTLVALAAARDHWGAAPDLVLSVGTAGGWAGHGTAVGDVFLAWDRFVAHDRRIDLPGFDRFGLGIPLGHVVQRSIDRLKSLKGHCKPAALAGVSGCSGVSGKAAPPPSGV